jgi:hypothetical protein
MKYVHSILNNKYLPPIIFIIAIIACTDFIKLVMYMFNEMRM